MHEPPAPAQGLHRPEGCFYPPPPPSNLRACKGVMPTPWHTGPALGKEPRALGSPRTMQRGTGHHQSQPPTSAPAASASKPPSPNSQGPLVPLVPAGHRALASRPRAVAATGEERGLSAKQR